MVEEKLDQDRREFDKRHSEAMQSIYRALSTGRFKITENGLIEVKLLSWRIDRHEIERRLREEGYQDVSSEYGEVHDRYRFRLKGKS